MRPQVTTKEELAARIQPVVIGADYTGYAYARGFWEAYGVKSIILANYDIKMILRSRFVDARVIAGIDGEKCLMQELRRLGEELCSAGRVAFLAPCGDFYTRIVSQHKAELEEWFYIPVPDFALVDDVMQKERFYEICEEVGMAYPMTRLFDCADPDAVLDDTGFRYPLVAKASNSAAWHYCDIPNKKKVYVIDDPAELRDLFDQLKASSYDKGLVVQEFVPGADDHMHVVYAYVDSHSDPVFMIDGHVALEDHHPAFIGNSVAIVPEDNQVVVEQAARFLKHIGYHGMCCFDAKYDDRDGSFRFLEMNTRPGRSSWLVLLAGINFARMQAEDCVLGIDPKPVSPSMDWCYVAAPRRVMVEHLEEGPLKDRVLKAFDEGRASYGLGWDKDCLSQKLWANVSLYHQVKKFREYMPK